MKKKKIIFSLIMTVMTLGIIEMNSRIIYFLLGESCYPVVPPRIMQLDDHLGWSLKPNAVDYSGRTGELIEYKINSFGLRDDEIDTQAIKQKFRIVLLGDSYTFGFGVAIDRHFFRLLENYLANTEVINLGVLGYGVDQMLLYFKQKGLPFRPDLVLMFIPHLNDERHLHTRRWGIGKPMFRLTNDRLVPVNDPVTNNPFYFQLLRPVDNNLTKYSRTYLFFRNYIMTGLIVRDSQPLYTDQEYSFKLAFKIITEIKKISESNRARFVVVTRKKYIFDTMQENGIRSLLVFADTDSNRYELPGNLHHLNEAGNRVLADKIAGFLQVNSWLKLAGNPDRFEETSGM
jgi:hypothetical protein